MCAVLTRSLPRINSPYFQFGKRKYVIVEEESPWLLFTITSSCSSNHSGNASASFRTNAHTKDGFSSQCSTETS